MLLLIYASRITGDPALLDIDALVVPSRINNRAAEITGLLIRRGAFFLHVMEGPRSSVEDTFLRIISDRRHHSLLVLARRVVGWRDFGAYEMDDVVSLNDQEDALDRIAGYLMPGSPDAQRRMRELRSAA